MNQSGQAQGKTVFKLLVEISQNWAHKGSDKYATEGGAQNIQCVSFTLQH